VGGGWVRRGRIRRRRLKCTGEGDVDTGGDVEGERSPVGHAETLPRCESELVLDCGGCFFFFPFVVRVVRVDVDDFRLEHGDSASRTSLGRRRRGSELASLLLGGFDTRVDAYADGS